jgi:lipoate-protein ligase A
MSVAVYKVEENKALDNLARETVILESLGHTESTLLLLYVNEPCIVIGRNQNPWREVNPDSSFPVLRRASGGGAVYHDAGNLNWALIVPRALHDQAAELRLISEAIRSCGFEVQPGERGGIYASKTSKYAGRKVSGTARRFGTNKVLHHGTLLVRADLSAMRSALGGMTTFDDNSMASVTASPINLIDMKPGTSIESLIEGIAAHLAGKSPERLPENLINPEAFIEAKTLLASRDWIYGSTPSFSLRVGGAHSVDLRVEKGKLVGFGNDNVDEWLAALCGEPFSFTLAKKIAQRMTARAVTLEEGR